MTKVNDGIDRLNKMHKLVKSHDFTKKKHAKSSVIYNGLVRHLETIESGKDEAKQLKSIQHSISINQPVAKENDEIVINKDLNNVFK